MRYTVRLITTWSGPLPRYFPLFFGTAACNPTIEFIFVADSSQPYSLPQNVKWVEMPFPEILRYMGERLGCDLSHVKPYKMCDFKPAFGIAFADLLAGCDFWGHVDCDLVLGYLRSFISIGQKATSTGVILNMLFRLGNGIHFPTHLVLPGRGLAV